MARRQSKDALERHYTPQPVAAAIIRRVYRGGSGIIIEAGAGPAPFLRACMTEGIGSDRLTAIAVLVWLAVVLSVVGSL